VSDKIVKFLKKLNARDLKRVIADIEKLQSGDDNELDLKPLRGRKNLYRIRSGNVRIVVKKSDRSCETR
jgi:mRNA-degrading endonuclease RelE of RelBE toxin-antitoxin system